MTFKTFFESLPRTLIIGLFVSYLRRQFFHVIFTVTEITPCLLEYGVSYLRNKVYSLRCTFKIAKKFLKSSEKSVTVEENSFLLNMGGNK